MTSATVEFDPFSEEYFNDPSDVYRRLRDEAPVYYSERYGFYALSRFDDVVAAHRDWQGFSSSHGVDLASLRTDPEFLRDRRMIIMMDPPEHDVLRALVSRVFTPRAMTVVEPMVREVIESFLTPLEDRDEFDVSPNFRHRSRWRSSPECSACPRPIVSNSANGKTPACTVILVRCSPTRTGSRRWGRRPRTTGTGPEGRLPWSGQRSR